MTRFSSTPIIESDGGEGIYSRSHFMCSNKQGGFPPPPPPPSLRRYDMRHKMPTQHALFCIAKRAPLRDACHTSSEEIATAKEYLHSLFVIVLPHQRKFGPFKVFFGHLRWFSATLLIFRENPDKCTCT